MRFINQDTEQPVTIKKTLQQISNTITVPAGATKYIDENITIDPCELRTLFAETNNKKNIQISLFDNKNGTGTELYRSLISNSIKDIIDIPFTDKNGNKQIHVAIVNSETVDITVTYTINITNF